MRRFASTAFALFLATPAFASGLPPLPAPTLLMNTTPLPVTRQGRLVNYIFVTLRLSCRPGTDMVKVRTKEPFFRDALVRSAARDNLAEADGVHVDLAKLKAAVVRDAAAVIGPGVIIDVKIVKQEAQKQFVR